MPDTSRPSPVVSVVVPILNEDETLQPLHRRLTDTLTAAVGPDSYEIILVDDGSGERSKAMMAELHRQDRRVKVIHLSRNFGHQMALSAGIDDASGDCVVLIDGDLQDPPELISKLIAKWREEFEVVFAVRRRRKESVMRRIAFFGFYRALKSVSATDMPLDSGIFSLLDRKAADVLRAMPERNRYLSGLRAWIGFRQGIVEYDREPRFAGEPRQSLARLARLGLDALFSFSYLPLRVATLVGVVVSAGAFSVGMYALYARLFTDAAIAGWTSTLVSTTFLSGLILLTLGVIGEYLARIYDELKGRPKYVVSARLGFDGETSATPGSSRSAGR